MDAIEIMINDGLEELFLGADRIDFLLHNKFFFLFLFFFCEIILWNRKRAHSTTSCNILI